MPDRRAVLVQRTAQFRNQCGCTERSVWHLVTHIDVGGPQAWAAAPEVELTGAPRVVLIEVCRAVVVVGGVDSRAKVHGRLPTEIIVNVIPLCDPDVYSTQPTGPLTLKE